jgi:ABC-type polysaccharide/polyol phosphate transport system ATPase subunit
MSDVVIRAENLGKRYRVGERERYLALRDILARAFSNPFTRKPRPPKDFLWALKEVSFEIRQGEVVGLVGRNGAGKTTLLKLLSRITKPTDGSAEIHGRIGSLLEVGTGFHPELTGRENIYLSGAILGMRKREIDSKYEAIVEFAGVARFIDTPLKFFSTGMQMRLAFAVAAHLEPEILLVDEVLAVGDTEFQKKCLGKMQDISHSGRTIIFVSHQTNQIRRLCERVFWIDGGRLRQTGPTSEVVANYESIGLQAGETSGSGRYFLSWAINGDDNIVREDMTEVAFHFRLRLDEPISEGHFGLNVYTDAGTHLAGWGFDNVNIPAGHQELIMRVPVLPFRPGAYSMEATLFNRGNNITGGKTIEHWWAQPPLIIDTKPVAHPQDQFAGLMNIAANLGVKP